MPIPTETISTPPLPTRRRLSGFSLFVLGAFISNLGTWMQIVAVGWLVAELTRDPIWAGMITFSGGIPVLLLSLVGGLVADHFDRRKFLLLTQTLLLVFAACLAVLTHLHRAHLWQIAVLTCLTGIATALNNPVYNSFVFDIVGKERVARAVAIHATQLHLSRALGPLLAGVAIGVVGTSGCFALNAVSFLAVIPLIATIPLSETQVRSRIRLRQFGKTLSEVFRFLHAQGFLLMALGILALCSFTVNPHLSLLPLYLKNSLGFGPRFLGAIWALSGAGSILTTLLYSRVFHSRTDGFLFRSAACAAILCGAGLILLSVFRSPFALALTIFFMGFCFTAVSLSCQILLQVHSPAALRGRLMSIWNLCFQGMFPIGGLVFGALAQQKSIPIAWCVAGITLTTAVLGILVCRVYSGYTNSNYIR